MKKCNFICEEHKLTDKREFGARCPKCVKAMTCLGDRWRIGRRGKFDKVEGRAKKQNSE